MRRETSSSSRLIGLHLRPSTNNVFFLYLDPSACLCVAAVGWWRAAESTPAELTNWPFSAWRGRVAVPSRRRRRLAVSLTDPPRRRKEMRKIDFVKSKGVRVFVFGRCRLDDHMVGSPTVPKPSAGCDFGLEFSPRGGLARVFPLEGRVHPRRLAGGREALRAGGVRDYEMQERERS